MEPKIYKEEDIQNYINNSDIFVITAMLALDTKDAVRPKEAGIIDSMISYFNRFNTITDKHFALARRRLLPYASTLTEWMNENVTEYENAYGKIVK